MNGLSVLSILVILSAPGPSISSPSIKTGSEVVRPVLTEEAFPWYDARTEQVKPLLPPDLRTAWLDWLGEKIARPLQWIFERLGRLRGPKSTSFTGLGDLIAIGLALLVLTVVLVLLLELLRRYRPLGLDLSNRKDAGTIGTAQSIEGLPAGLRLDTSDPWVEAQRLKGVGDYAGAVIHLFAHQLLTLDRLKLVRMIPGRTGRQLVRSVADRQLRSTVEPTLRLFEAVYYGHNIPTRDAFDAIWSDAISFEASIASEARK